MSIYPHVTEMTIGQWRELFAAPDARIQAAFVLIGPILALQNRHAERSLRGLSVSVDGDIPVAAGVSSSSAFCSRGVCATSRISEAPDTLSMCVV